MPPQPSRPAALARQVFRGSEAVRLGLLSRHQLRGASWLRLRQDVYADARLHRDHGLACRAAVLRLPPEAVLAGPSAAYLLGVEHAASFTDDVHVLVPRSARIDSQPGIRVHTLGAAPALLPVGGGPATRAGDGRTLDGRAGGDRTLDDHPAGSRTGAAGAAADPASGPATAGQGAVERTAAGLGIIDGTAAGVGSLRWTQPAQAAWETAVWLEPFEAVPIVDSLLGRGLVTWDDLTAVTEHNADRPGGRRARWVFGLADGGAQSPPESQLRLRLVLAGLPRPVTQHPVRLASGLVLHPDLAWPAFRVAVEYDGHWHADAEQLHRDRQRLNHLVGAGWVVLHVTSRRLHRDFPAVVREVRAALVSRGWRR
ncbi:MULTISPECIES: hypothetical protein [Micromonospora]|uniref:DUF559 domain-containing protein n=1 Tax=Micromonospora haikouensis TaxID=686309 RepID=A0A0D0WXV3_9ACTN|nr:MULTISPECIES: hypothetical protein [Micromonospora]KIR63449.1 hypothetical protein TK50_17550 [Micromonospora haikouensis]